MSKFNLSVLMLSVIAVLSACNKQEEAKPLREEYIKVYSYDLLNRETEVNNVQVPFEGARDARLTVDSNQDIEWRYQISLDEVNRDWFLIKSVDTDSLGRMVFTYDADSILDLNTLERRSGKLSFSCEDVYLGKFVTIQQGYVQRWAEDFEDYEGERLSLSGREVYETEYIHVINTDYYDYLSFNAYAKSENEYLENNITLDIAISGGPFFAATNRTSYRVNVPLDTLSSAANLKYMIMSNGGEVMGSKTKIKLTVSNDDGVTVYVDNLHLYKVSEAELMDLSDDEEFNESEEWE